jgi:N-acetyl sugar amidotransferase
MKTLKVCTVCVMDTSDSDIYFDRTGQCNHCIEAKKKLDLGWFPNTKGADLLELQAKTIRELGKGKDYDCIIGVSGGVDSSYLLHVAVNQMKLRPLVVHVDCGWNSEIAVKNIELLVKALNLDLFTYVVDWNEMQDLQLAFLKSSVANQDTPQDHAIFAKLYEFADKNNIKFALSGSNLSSESILPNSWGYSASDLTQIRAIHKKFGTNKLDSFPTMGFWRQKIYWPYFKKMEKVAPLNFINFDKNEAIQFLEQNYGWRYYGGKHHESKWTKYFQASYLPSKFNYDKRKAHLSSMIVSGQMTRVDAIIELKKALYNDVELKEDKHFIAKKLSISLEELNEIEKLENKSYQNYPNEAKLALRLSKLKALIKFSA